MTMELTTAQKDALRRFVATHGHRSWKQAMRRLWSRAIASTDDETLLYALRNTHGPGWLLRVKLDESEVLK